MFFCRSTMSTAYIWCTDLAYCKWQDSISLVSLSLHLRKMASLTWCWLYSYVHVLCYACAEDARENLSQKKKTKPILKLGAFHCWSVRLCVYKGGFPKTTFFILELCQLTDFFSSPTSLSSAGLPSSIIVRFFGITRIRNSDLAEITRIIKGADESLPREDYRFFYIMMRVISDHWSWSGPFQRNAPCEIIWNLAG